MTMLINLTAVSKTCCCCTI